ncbi:MAG: ATP-binding cassette domain-containing protein [Bacillota bacterium]
MRHWRRIRRIEKAYGAKVLSFGPFDFKQRVILLVGKNGSGKTTLLKCLAGLLRTEKGFLKHPMTYIGGEDTLPVNLTGGQYLSAMLRVVGGHHANRLQRLIDHFDLNGFLKHPIKEYSDGMLRRTALAGGLLKLEGTVLLDEPMRALDGVYRKRLVEWISQSNTPFMIATHDPTAFKNLDYEKVTL